MLLEIYQCQLALASEETDKADTYALVGKDRSTVNIKFILDRDVVSQDSDVLHSCLFGSALISEQWFSMYELSSPICQRYCSIQ